MFNINFLNYRPINSNEKWCLIMRLSIAPQRPYNNKPKPEKTTIHQMASFRDAHSMGCDSDDTDNDDDTENHSIDPELLRFCENFTFEVRIFCLTVFPTQLTLPSSPHRTSTLAGSVTATTVHRTSSQSAGPVTPSCSPPPPWRRVPLAFPTTPTTKTRATTSRRTMRPA